MASVEMIWGPADEDTSTYPTDTQPTPQPEPTPAPEGGESRFMKFN